MKVIITLKKSVIGSKPEHIATVKALGLKKTNSSVVKELHPPDSRHGTCRSFTG